MALLAVDDALGQILDGVNALPAERVDLLKSSRRVLASDVLATLTHPPFHASAMDGYAVKEEDVTKLPAELQVVGESAAGSAFEGHVSRGQAVRIFTGAPVPEGADAIVIQENVDQQGGRIIVREGVPDKPHIRTMGSDFKEGAVLLKSGETLTARSITLAAAAGHAALDVRRRPTVAILATGNELVPPGSVPDASQIVSSNPYGLAAMVEAFGGVAQVLGIARDRHDDIAAKIDLARDADILVTIGGASVGDHDLIAPAFQKKGLDLAFWKIAMRPGKPMLFGRLGSQRVLGLPGNPVSCLICARVFLVPLIQRLLGAGGTFDAKETAVLAQAVDSNGPRRHYMRAVVETKAGQDSLVTPLPSQDSALLSALAAANALIVREPRAAAAPIGSSVPILRLDF